MNAPFTDLQRAFASGLMGDDPSPALSLLRPLAGRVPGLAVYRHAYRSRMTAALRDNHPVLHRVLGDEAFDQLAADYLRAHPSRQASIRWFGDQLAGFLASSGMDHAPALAELARVEWTLGLVLDAADAVPLDASTLQTHAPETWASLPLRLHPAARVLALAWDITPLWQALHDDADASTDLPQARTHHVLVWRQGLARHWRLCDPDEAALLLALQEGTDIGTLCRLQADATGSGDAPSQVAGHLHRWLADGVLVWDPGC